MNSIGLTHSEVEIPSAVRRADAWVGLCLALALHVVDEGATFSSRAPLTAGLASCAQEIGVSLNGI